MENPDCFGDVPHCECRKIFNQFAQSAKEREKLEQESREKEFADDSTAEA
jgi:hypothetical protein